MDPSSFQELGNITDNGIYFDERHLLNYTTDIQNDEVFFNNFELPQETYMEPDNLTVSLDEIEANLGTNIFDLFGEEFNDCQEGIVENVVPDNIHLDNVLITEKATSELSKLMDGIEKDREIDSISDFFEMDFCQIDRLSNEEENKIFEGLNQGVQDNDYLNIFGLNNTIYSTEIETNNAQNLDVDHVLHQLSEFVNFQTDACTNNNLHDKEIFSTNAAEEATTSDQVEVIEINDSSCKRTYGRKNEGIKYKIYQGQKIYICNPQLYICAACDAQFSVLDEAKEHVKFHVDISTLQCKTCNKICASKSRLTEHLVTHLDVKAFECEICKKKFACKRFLNKHKLLHMEEKKYICIICGASHRCKANLEIHYLNHAQVKQQVCSICSISFNRKLQLNLHMKTMHGAKENP